MREASSTVRLQSAATVGSAAAVSGSKPVSRAGIRVIAKVCQVWACVHCTERAVALPATTFSPAQHSGSAGQTASAAGTPAAGQPSVVTATPYLAARVLAAAAAAGVLVAGVITGPAPRSGLSSTNRLPPIARAAATATAAPPAPRPPGRPWPAVLPCPAVLRDCRVGSPGAASVSAGLEWLPGAARPSCGTRSGAGGRGDRRLPLLTLLPWTAASWSRSSAASAGRWAGSRAIARRSTAVTASGTPGRSGIGCSCSAITVAMLGAGPAGKRGGRPASSAYRVAPSE